MINSDGLLSVLCAQAYKALSHAYLMDKVIVLPPFSVSVIRCQDRSSHLKVSVISRHELSSHEGLGDSSKAGWRQETAWGLWTSSFWLDLFKNIFTVVKYTHHKTYCFSH